jgi:hypothetical protein
MPKTKITDEKVIQRFQKFNLLPLEPYQRAHQKIKTLCVCGKEFYVRASHVFQGRIKSCGCYAKWRL